MKTRSSLILFALACLSPHPLQVVAQSSGKGAPSAHVKGPNGLEGWTLNYPVPGYDLDNKYPMTLVIARHGRVIRRIAGEPFVWSWIFWADGKQLAIMAGPLHFSMNCVLEDLTSGKELASYDCYHEVPEPQPDWVKALEAAE